MKAIDKRTKEVLTDCVYKIFLDGARTKRDESAKIVEEWRERLITFRLCALDPSSAIWLCDEIIASIRARDDNEQEVEPLPDVPCTLLIYGH